MNPPPPKKKSRCVSATKVAYRPELRHAERSRCTEELPHGSRIKDARRPAIAPRRRAFRARRRAYVTGGRGAEGGIVGGWAGCSSRRFAAVVGRRARRGRRRRERRYASVRTTVVPRGGRKIMIKKNRKNARASRANAGERARNRL